MGLLDNLYHMSRRLGWKYFPFYRLPFIGEINGRFLFEPPRLLTDAYGPTSFTPTVLEILVDDIPEGKMTAGVLAKQHLFSHYHPLVFNVCFACARPSLLFGGDYANPLSHWFNVFFGFYEIDVAMSQWDRPFGFTSSEDRTALNFDDLLRIGKADWNLFSNYIYGVPLEHCIEQCAITDTATFRIIDDSVSIGGHTYVEVEASNVTVVSGYVSGEDGQKLRYNDRFWSPIWRAVFGRSKTNKQSPYSFLPTRMKMRFFIRFETGADLDLEEDAYKTFIYGGAINMDYRGDIDNDRFLAAQMDGVKACIEKKSFHKRTDAGSTAAWKSSRQTKDRP